MTDLPEVTPQKVADDIDVVLTLSTYGERDGQAWAVAHVTDSSGTAEAKARQWLSSDKRSRHAGIVRVRVPRALLNERWTEADR